jgi:hypothetical protein
MQAKTKHYAKDKIVSDLDQKDQEKTRLNLNDLFVRVKNQKKTDRRINFIIISIVVIFFFVSATFFYI